MTPFYRIIEISTERRSRETYLTVWFWRQRADYDAGKPHVHLNDFIMTLRPTAQRIVTDAQGRWKRDDGRFIDVTALTEREQVEAASWQFETETATVDVRAAIRVNISAYAKRWAEAARQGKPYPTDYRDPRILLDEIDPHRILERQDVQTLKDRGFAA